MRVVPVRVDLRIACGACGHDGSAVGSSDNASQLPAPGAFWMCVECGTLYRFGVIAHENTDGRLLVAREVLGEETCLIPAPDLALAIATQKRFRGGDDRLVS